MSKILLFLISVVLSAGVFLAIIYTQRPKKTAAPDIQVTAPELNLIADNVYLSAQLKLSDIDFLKKRGIKTLVDVQPDTEVEGPPSMVFESAFKGAGMNFHYIPVAHDSIADQAVTALSGVLAHDAKPTVLYCRTGRRAIRTYALAEASRADGPSAESILEMVRVHGFSAQDIRDNVAERISHRSDNNHALKN